MMNLPKLSICLEPGEPLRKRAPACDKHGNALSDFMVLFKGLRDKPRIQAQETIENIRWVLARFSDVVAFADLNIKLNLLWVSIKPIADTRRKIGRVGKNNFASA